MSSCGCSSQPAILTKIYGGSPARPHTWEWTVSLRSGNNYFCGGSILNQWYIITAAHCLENRMQSLSTLTICAGTNRLSGACPQNRSAQHAIIHSGYNNRTMENDIALIRVNIPFDFDDTSIARICLPNATHPNEYPKVGTDVTAVGWGKTKKTNHSETLRQVTVRVVNESADSCHPIVRNHRLQLCAAAPGKDTCSGDSGGPLMVFTAAKRWELIGITSYGVGCAKKYSGIYTRITAFLTFIHNILNGTSSTCACECPRGVNQGPAYTTEYSAEACVEACIDVSSYACTSSNTYACLGTNCVYSDSYRNLTTTSIPQYTCSCECPRGSDQGSAYSTEYSAEACVAACKDISWNRCTSFNTYACLGTNCVYSGSYKRSTTSIPQYTCSCECPRGSDQGSAYSTEYSAEACVAACKDISWNRCTSFNTYACLGTNCVYSGSYERSTTSIPQYTCSCECPRGSDQGSAYTTKYSAEACVDACKNVSSNPCTSSNTYACLGKNCVYSDSYKHSTTTSMPQYKCSCECPRGSDQGSAYTTKYSAEACVDACKNVSSNLCNSSNTYACLGTNCVYSDSYEHSITTSIPQHTCSCECPRGSYQGSAYTTKYSAEACVDACKDVSWNPCTNSNTYACFGTNCVYSDSYEHSKATSIPQYTCSCECPRGSDQISAYTTEYSAEACLDACKNVSSNYCTSSNTYACLGTNCVYSDSYEHSTASIPQYTCSCECPRGSDQGSALTTKYSAEACVAACKDVSWNSCTSSNTYACLETNCVYSDSYEHSKVTSIPQYTCSCECPRGSNRGSAYTTKYSAEACVAACKDGSSNPCTSSNTYACLGTNCVYSDSYEHSKVTSILQHTCSCECPRGSYQGSAYTTEYSAEACVAACKDVSWNPCTNSNTYACLGTKCAYSKA